MASLSLGMGLCLRLSRPPGGRPEREAGPISPCKHRRQDVRLSVAHRKGMLPHIELKSCQSTPFPVSSTAAACREGAQQWAP